MKRIFLITTLVIVSLAGYGNSDPRIDSLKKCIQRQPEGNLEHIVSLNEIAKLYWINHPDSSEIYARLALTYSKALDDTLAMAESNRMLGVSLWVRGDHKEALKRLFTSRDFFQHARDTLGYANAVMNIGLVYRDQEDYTRAFPNFFLSYGIFRALGLEERLINTANHLGVCYMKKGDKVQASRFFEEALVSSQELNYSYGTATAFYNLGELTSLDSSWNQSRQFLEKALHLQYDIGDIEGAAKSCHMIGIVLAARGSLKDAVLYLHKAEELALHVSSKLTLSEVYRSMTCILEKKGNHQAALSFFKKHHDLRDSLFNAGKMQEIARMEDRIHTEKAEQASVIAQQRITMLEQINIHKQRWVNGLILCFVLIMIFTFLYIRMVRKNNVRKRILAENRKKLADYQLENARLKEVKIREQLELKEKKLASYSLNFIQKNEVMENVKESLKELEKQGDDQMNRKVNHIQKQLKASFHIDRSWDNFRMTFENIHSGFFSSLIRYCPKITQNEMKLCALIKLQLNLKESAAVLGISPESVKTARYRLRKKLDIDSQISLHQFMENIHERSRAA
jgi:tetratricopeptide (TPR) repeat protein